jgi:hypothetical protein
MGEWRACSHSPTHLLAYGIEPLGGKHWLGSLVLGGVGSVGRLSIAAARRGAGMETCPTPHQIPKNQIFNCSNPAQE